jgi:5-formyltetrahydrofolate cyclo-ligase
MNKKDARSYYREKRAQLDQHARQKLQDLILIRFQHLHFPFVECAHSYLPIEGKNEPDPNPIIRSLAFRNPGMLLAVPRIISSSEMANIIISDLTEFQKNEFGILEPLEGEIISPEQIDLVIVPLLGFDRKGNRVGYGKGYYDRFLTSCREDVIKIGLSFFDPLEIIDDTQEWDIPLDYCITPQEAYEF